MYLHVYNISLTHFHAVTLLQCYFTALVIQLCRKEDISTGVAGNPQDWVLHPHHVGVVDEKLIGESEEDIDEGDFLSSHGMEDGGNPTPSSMSNTFIKQLSHNRFVRGTC